MWAAPAARHSRFMSDLLPAAALLASPSPAAVTYLSLLAVFGVAALVLFVSALVSILRCPTLTSNTRVAWVLGIVVFPFVGPLLWFTVGRPRVTQP
jgi:hypothetical protein